MSDDRSDAAPRSAGRYAPDDLLPPVEAPNFAFLAQLFLIPALIVTILLGVWLGINWLAHMGGNPAQYVEALERDNDARWQAAVSLADALRSKTNDKLKHDRETALRLAAMLERETHRGQLDPADLKLRLFLSRALGEFLVPEVLPALMKSATIQRDPREAEVRCAALEALAVYLSHMEAVRTNPPPDLLDCLRRAATDADDRLVRSTAAFTLGVLGGAPACEVLADMLDDTWPDTRFNAAAALARQGDLRAIDVLLVMLDPLETEGIVIETETGAQDFKRHLILATGLQSAKLLAATHRGAELQPLVAAVDALLTTPLDPDLKLEAAETARRLKASAAEPTAAP